MRHRRKPLVCRSEAVDTVPRKSGSSLIGHTLDVQSQTISCTECVPSSIHSVASFIVEFRGMSGGTTHGLRMRLENRVRNAMMEEGDRSFLPVGTIYFWKWATSTWVAMPVSAETAMQAATRPDDSGVANGPTYRYWAPEDPPGGSLWYGMERDFRWSAEQSAGFISTDGRVRAKLVLKHPGAFTAKWDLVQLAWTNDSAWTIVGQGEVEEESLVLGANVNYDSSTDSNDVDTFVDAFMGGTTAGDFNQDGLVDLTDISEFVDAYANGGGG